MNNNNIFFNLGSFINQPNGVEPVIGLIKRNSITIPVKPKGKIHIVKNLAPKNLIEPESDMAFLVDV